MSEENVDLGQLLDVTLDELSDMPSFEPYPDGTHKALISFEQAVINEHPSIVAKFKYVECLELADGVPVEKTPQPGDEAQVSCMLDNEFGQGSLKNMATPIGTALGVSRIGDVIEQAVDFEVVIMTKVNKKGYMTVVEDGLLVS